MLTKTDPAEQLVEALTPAAELLNALLTKMTVEQAHAQIDQFAELAKASATTLIQLRNLASSMMEDA